MSDRLLVRDDLEIFYDEIGDGPPVLYAHGMMLSRAGEDRLNFRDWAPVAARRRLVRYDAPGHGLSSGPLDETAYTWPRLADTMLALVDELGAPIDCMGASMGCGTLLTAAVRAPERFNRLVLIIPPTAWETRTWATSAYRAGADLAEKEGKDAFVALVGQMPAPPLLAELPGYPPVPDISAERLPFVLRGAAASDLPDPAELGAVVTHPTLILAWDTDPGHPVSTAEKLAATLPNAELHISRTIDDVRTWGARAAEFLV